MTEIERLRAENERLRDALLDIRGWANAYPVAVFRPLAPGELDAAVNAMTAIRKGLPDAVHGSWARHILDGIGGKADAALGESGETP